MMQDLTNYTPGYYYRDQAEYWFQRWDLLRPDQLAALCYAFNWPFFSELPILPQRDPGLVYSIGCGHGILEAKMEQMGCRVTGIDPSPGPKEIYRGTQLLDEYPGGGDTIIFCESLEHIPVEDIFTTWSRIPSTARIIIVNWVDHMPIEPEPPFNDHITLIDDALYDKLSEGRNVILRRGSHLVLQ